jgi:hypothetical protein
MWLCNTTAPYVDTPPFAPTPSSPTNKLLVP